jgi:hypothetical protein
MCVRYNLVGRYLDNAETGQVTITVDGYRPARTGLVPDHDCNMRCDQARLVEPVSGDVTGERLVAAPDRVPRALGGAPFIKARRRRVEVTVDVPVNDIGTSLLPDPSRKVGAPLFGEVGVGAIVSSGNSVCAVLIAVGRGRVGHITELAIRNGRDPFAQRG